MYPIQGRLIGSQQLTGMTAATPLVVPSGTRMALLTAEAQIVRIGTSAAVPTATVGFPLPVGQMLAFYGDLSTLRFIQATGGAILNVLYLGG